MNQAAAVTKLSVNVNKIATLRNTRPKLNIPDLLALARLVLEAGAPGLTIHPRPDERHIRGRDVEPLAKLAREFGVEFNIEGNPFEGEFMNHCRRVRPTQCTLVPDEGSQSTSDHGWNLPRDVAKLRPMVAELKSIGCRVSLFVDAETLNASAVVDTNADRVELYTEPYAVAFERGDPHAATHFVAASHAATSAGLGVNAGHDLNLHNLAPFLATVPNVLEVSISHALTADALVFGMAEAVRKYLAACAGESQIQ